MSHNFAGSVDIHIFCCTIMGNVILFFKMCIYWLLLIWICLYQTFCFVRFMTKNHSFIFAITEEYNSEPF